jgi:hypothetical protein
MYGGFAMTVETRPPAGESAQEKKSPSSTAYRSATPTPAMVCRARATEVELMSVPCTVSSGTARTTCAMARASPLPSSATPSDCQGTTEAYWVNSSWTENA